MNISSDLNRYRIYLFLFMSLLSSLFFVGGPNDHSCRSLKLAWNLGHIIYYAFLPLLILSFPLKIELKQSVKVLIIIAITLLLGFFVEILQNGLNRTLDVGDLYRNMLGASVAILFYLPNRDFISRGVLITLKSIVIVLVMIQFVPVGIALIDEQQARYDYPVLSDLQTPFQISRWNGNAVTGVVNTTDRPGNSALKVTLTTAKYSGVSLKFFPEEWEPYSLFQFSVYNPSTETLTLTCRIHDRNHNNEFHDRFNRSYLIIYGWNFIQINLRDVREAPESRQMDLNQIRSVGIFTTRLPQPRDILIDDLKLF
jgi:VanZ family protein